MKKFRKLWLLLALGLMLAGCGSGKTAEKEPEAVVAEDAASEEAAVPDEQQESVEPETEESNLPEPEESISERRGESEPAETVYGKADVLITGDIGHHEGIDAAAQGMAVIDAGHYGIERIFVEDMERYLAEKLSGVEIRTAPVCHPFVSI